MSTEFGMMTILDEGGKLLQKLWICDWVVGSYMPIILLREREKGKQIVVNQRRKCSMKQGLFFIYLIHE